ncbi:8-amino-7-oxononanoate synthase [Leptolyngbya sp. FACHB-261]|uniref:8-amino-7-oxononanoate synthase n=1 Tax=Leptolyngbya sp. FACHB-261 TaxID=2692806 RepID=UPI001681E383|nr:8-amino-7-oxononanoate synthase [Leptolyngbya sp. FACHB-261]MBD2099705.1 8-amino-7-oxononanoate synthase [Leptolyngbya sp. FACHB-261]
MSPYRWLSRSLATLKQAGWYRSVQPATGRAGSVVELDGQQLLNFASNNYLGLAGDERLIEAAVLATRTYGTGSTGSRLLTGHLELHRQLEQALARLKQTEDALVFSSGYSANLGTITALVGQRDLVLSDAYNHSSLKNGAILSGATVLDYAHLDLADLGQKLAQHRQSYRRCLLLSDSVFSMDGDLCPLPALLDLGDTYDCMLLLDEAHGTGVLGAHGAGLVEQAGCTGRPLVQVGTLSKALGSLGGYVAGSAELIDFLRNRAPSWIYTTALSPADTAAALKAVEIVQAEPERRAQLWSNVTFLRQALSGLDLLPSESPILCVRSGDIPQTLQLAQALRQAGIFAPAIRPPTVPTSRIRLTVMATHTQTDLRNLAQVLQSYAEVSTDSSLPTNVY